MPLIVRWPGKVEAGVVEKTPVILTDFHPTILAATGLDLNSTVPNDGHNLLPLLKGEEKIKNRVYIGIIPILHFIVIIVWAQLYAKVIIS